ncbi:MAG: fructose-bisphosphate aldolase class I [Gammaproteobacteria bacterium]|nr:fructose-bisphosphate aldolase class I [Gammaproteobacteria bacterium]
MYSDTLNNTVAAMTAPGKGLLAADESTNTIKKRFDTITLESTEESRRDYREMLFTTPQISDYISGVILFEETLSQVARSGQPLAELLIAQGILPGIKVDKGLIPLNPGSAEKCTQGLDGLGQKLQQARELGARFAKWRGVYSIAHTLPSRQSIHVNAEGLARYAAICQSEGIVPIVEPEVLMDGEHDIHRCERVTTEVLAAVFNALRTHGVTLEQMILKPNMVLPGAECTVQAGPQEVAEATVRTFKRTVPAAVPGIMFLSGGQSEQAASANLNAINALNTSKPWVLSYSYGRALQAPALQTWGGRDENVTAAQTALAKRARLNSAAAVGGYRAEMEQVA